MIRADVAWVGIYSYPCGCFYASSKYADASLRPKLVITYTSDSGAVGVASSGVSRHSAFTVTGTTVAMNENFAATLTIYDLSGCRIKTVEIDNGGALDLSGLGLPSGMHAVKIAAQNGIVESFNCLIK